MIYLNKMDKEGACEEKCIKVIKDRLPGADYPLLLQIPVGTGSGFVGVADVLDLKIIDWIDRTGTSYELRDIKLDSPLGKKALKARETLVEQLADLDPVITELLLTTDDLRSIDSVTLRQSIARVTQANLAFPVLLGSSLKNRGVQPVLDSIIEYLPSPLRRPPTPARSLRTGKSILVPSSADSLDGPPVALAFKVIHDRHKGLIVYGRIYSGHLKSGSSFFYFFLFCSDLIVCVKKGDKVINTSKNVEERIMGLFRINAQSLTPVDEASAGDIVGIVGLKHTQTGDTLLLTPTGCSRTTFKGEKELIETATKSDLILEGIRMVPPVFTCSIETDTQSDHDNLMKSLDLLKKEDPSFEFTINQETGQTLLSGMGELHIEILHHRLLEHYNLKTYIGKMQIAYKSCIRQGLFLLHFP